MNSEGAAVGDSADYALDTWDEELEVVGVDNWERLKGQLVRVKGNWTRGDRQHPRRRVV